MDFVKILSTKLGRSLWEEFARSYKLSVKVCKTGLPRKGHVTGS